MFQADVGVVHGPDDSVDVSGNVEEDGKIRESLDRGLSERKASTTASDRFRTANPDRESGETHLDDLSDLGIDDAKESHLEHTRLETELDEAVDGREANDSRAVNRSNLPRPILGNRVQVIVGNSGNLCATTFSVESKRASSERGKRTR